MKQDAHPAAQANINSFAAVKAQDKATWLGLFADDVVVQDPVGVSALDPTGKGHRGKEAVSGFWDMVIAGNTLSFDVKMRVPRGNECAVMASLINRMPNGEQLETEMIVIYKVNAEGKIQSLRAFWDFDGLSEKIAQLTAQSS